jgi:hypothetical protein
MFHLHKMSQREKEATQRIVDIYPVQERWFMLKQNLREYIQNERNSMSTVLSTYHILSREYLYLGTSTKDMNTNHIRHTKQRGTHIMRLTDQEHILDILLQDTTHIQNGGSHIGYQE